MTPAKFAALVRLYTSTNAVTFTDANILSYANIFKDDIAAEIAKRNEDYFGIEFTRNLEADKRQYSIPDEVLNNIKYTQAMLDGISWQRLEEFDLSQYKKTTDETSIRNNFTGKNPQFDIWNRLLCIYSGDAIINVTNGLKLWAIIYPADITDLSSTTDMAVDPTTTSHGFPRQFHELLARRISIAYKSSKDKPIPLSEKEQKYDDDLKVKLDAITGMNLDRSFVASTPSDDGQDY